MIHRLLCLIFGHRRATYEHTATFSKDGEFNYGIYRCKRCMSMIWDDSEEIARDPKKDYVIREDLDAEFNRCKSEHTEVSE